MILTWERAVEIQRDEDANGTRSLQVWLMGRESLILIWKPMTGAVLKDSNTWIGLEDEQREDVLSSCVKEWVKWNG